MVRLRWLYGAGLLFALTLAMVPATRDAGWPSLRCAVDPRAGKIGDGLWFPNDLERDSLAADLDEPRAWCAAAEGYRRLAPAQRDQLDTAVRRAPDDDVVQLRAAAIAVGQLHDAESGSTKPVPPPALVAWAKARVATALERQPLNGHPQLLSAYLAAREQRWPAAVAALQRAAAARECRTAFGESRSRVAMLYRSGGLPAAESAVVAWWTYPAEAPALRRMADAVVGQARACRSQGDAAAAADLLRALARAGERLQRAAGPTALGDCGWVLQQRAFSGARPDGTKAPEETWGDALQVLRAQQYAALMRAVGDESEAAWALTEPARWSQFGAALRAGADAFDEPLESLASWHRLARVLAGAALLLPLCAWLMIGAARPVDAVGWRWHQALPLALAAILPGVIHACQHVAEVREHCLCLGDFSVGGLAANLVAVALGVLVPLAWLLGWLHARRAGPARLDLARRTATRLVLVPVLTAQALLLLLMLACTVPMAVCRDRLAATVSPLETAPW